MCRYSNGMWDLYWTHEKWGRDGELSSVFLKSDLIFCCLHWLCLPGTGKCHQWHSQAVLQQTHQCFLGCFSTAGLHPLLRVLLPYESWKAPFVLLLAPKCPFWCCLCCARLYPAEMPQSSCLQYLERQGRGKEGFWCSDCSISMNLQPSMESVTIYWPVLHTEIQIPAKQHFSDLGKHPLSLIWNSAHSWENNMVKTWAFHNCPCVTK